MPTLDLLTVPARSDGGVLPVDPPFPGLPRVLFRYLVGYVRPDESKGWFPPQEAVVDTGAPLTKFPHFVWSTTFGWVAGRDYEDVPTAGGRTPTLLGGAVGGRAANYRLVRLKTAVDLIGRTAGVVLRLESLVALLEDEPAKPPAGSNTSNQKRVLLGLWGNALDGRAIRVGRKPGSDDLSAQLEF